MGWRLADPPAMVNLAFTLCRDSCPAPKRPWAWPRSNL